MYKKILAVATAACLIIGATGAAVAIQQTPEDPALAVATQAVEARIEEGLAPFYTVSDITCEPQDIDISDSGFSIIVGVFVSMTLKAETPEELPAIQGLLSAAGLETVANTRSAHDTEASLMVRDVALSEIVAANPAKSTIQKAAALAVLNDQIANVRQYIGQEQYIHYTIKAIGTITDGIPTVTELQTDDGSGRYFPIEMVLPEAPTTVFSNYASDFWLAVEEEAVTRTLSSRAASNDYDTNRVAAATYAKTWVYHFGEDPDRPDEPAGLKCTECGKTSANDDGYQVTTYYNNDEYDYFTHTDCANFASQALVAGGFEPDNTWKFNTTAWNYAWGLEDYLVDNGLVVDKGYSLAHAGGLIFLKTSPSANAYHVEVIVKNDTATRQFCGHSHDRYNEGVVNSSNFKYYNVNY